MVNYLLKDRIAYLTIENGKVNAFGYEQIESMQAGLDKAIEEADAVVVTATGKVFSAGFDLKVIRQGPEAMQSINDAGTAMMNKLRNHPQPVICACNGHAVALGAIFLASCDYRIGVAGDFKVGLNETSIGVPLPLFAYDMVKSRVALKDQYKLLLLSELYTPEQAIGIGLLDEVVEANALMDRASEIALKMGRYDSDNYALNKINFVNHRV